MTMMADAAPSRIAGLDGLRGLMALCVIVAHCFGLFAPMMMARTRADMLGQGIVVFFVLSGFLIYLPFARSIVEGTKRPRLRSYARTRVFRVYPGYIVIFLLADFVLRAVFLENALGVEVSNSDRGTGMITNPWLVLFHLTLLQNYVPATLQTGLTPSWTLTVELAFYVILPLAILGFLRLARPLRLAPYLVACLPAIALLGLGIVTRTSIAIYATAHPGLSPYEIEWGPTPIAVVSRSILEWSDNFGLGMLACVAFLAIRSGALHRIAGLRPVVALWWTVAAFLVIAGIVFVLAGRLPTIAPRFSSLFVAAAAAAFIVIVVQPSRSDNPHSRLARMLDWAPLKYVGLVSLSTYLWHYPVMIVALRLGLTGTDTPLGSLRSIAVVILITIAVSTVTYWVVERPASQIGRRKRSAGRELDSTDGGKHPVDAVRDQVG